MPYEQFPTVLRSLVSAVKRKGFVLITLKQGEKYTKNKDGRVFYLWRQESVENIFSDLDLRIVNCFIQTSQVNNRDIWLTYLLGKPE